MMQQVETGTEASGMSPRFIGFDCENVRIRAMRDGRLQIEGERPDTKKTEKLPIKAGDRLTRTRRGNRDVWQLIETHTEMDVRYTQRITAADIKAGRIRVPGPTKSLFPEQPASVNVSLHGQRKSCSWNPRNGPDKSRSGVIGIGTDLAQRLTAGEPLRVTAGGGVIHLD
jgi:hypothetical protein